MKCRTECKSYELSHLFGLSIPQYGLEVDVPVQEIMDWFVPESVEFFVGCAVPPVIVELSVGKQSQFGKNIGHVLEHDIEEKDLDDGVGDYGPEQEFKKTDFLSLMYVD